MGTGAAFAISVVATVAPQVFPSSFVSMSRVAVYFEAATVIVLLTLVGQLLELNARSRISDAISAQVTLIEGDLRGISIAQAFSVATMGNMKQNLMFTFLYNALGIPLAAGVL